MADYGHAAVLATLPRCPNHPEKPGWFLSDVDGCHLCGTCAEQQAAIA